MLSRVFLRHLKRQWDRPGQPWRSCKPQSSETWGGLLRYVMTCCYKWFFVPHLQHWIYSQWWNAFSVVFLSINWHLIKWFFLQAGKSIPKRKQWTAEQTRGPKRVKVEVKSTQTETAECLTDGVSTEAYELMVKGRYAVILAPHGSQIDQPKNNLTLY